MLWKKIRCLFGLHNPKRNTYQDQTVWMYYEFCENCGKRLETGPTRLL